VLADWTNDGRPDFYNFKFNQATGVQDVIIYPALTSGYWDWDHPIFIPTPFTGTATTDPTFGNIHRLVDQNSDGKPDILYSSVGSNARTHIFMNTGTSFAAEKTTIWPSDSDTFINDIGYYDVTGDGNLDYVYISREGSVEQSIWYGPGNADGSFGTPVLVIANNATNQVNNTSKMAGDFNGDGKIDIVYTLYGTPNNTVRVLTNNGNGTFTLGNPMTFSRFTPIGPLDVNGDGKADLVGDRTDSFTVLYGQSDSTFTSSDHPKSNPSSTLRNSIADMNGDGRGDLISWSNTDYEVFLRNADGTFTSQIYPWITTSAQRFFMKVADFNADGKADMFDEYFPDRTFNLFGEEVLVIKSNVCSATAPPRFLNFDGNNLPDLVTWNPASGQWKRGDANFNSGSSIPTTTFQWGLGSLGDVPAPGDFDGDGKTDYTVFRNGEGNWYSYLSSNSSWAVFRFGTAGDIPVPNDYDGGGKTDYAVFRPSDGLWYIWFTETGQFAVHRWGMNGDRPVPADYDGDGKWDIGVFRPSDGAWYYVRSSDLNYVIIQWGISTDIPVPADYDGDLKADIAIFRSGVWYLYRSYNNSTAVLNWGTAGDVPIPVGQPGDISFPTVVRPSDTKWYRYNLGLGFALPVSGTPVYFGLPNN
jgi:hypothetical protein